MEFCDILSGAKPSDVLKDHLERNPSHTNKQASFRFADAFPKIGVEAIQLIWNWKSPARLSGIDDETLDAGVRKCLIDSGYLRSGEDAERA